MFSLWRIWKIKNWTWEIILNICEVFKCMWASVRVYVCVFVCGCVSEWVCACVYKLIPYYSICIVFGTDGVDAQRSHTQFCTVLRGKKKNVFTDSVTEIYADVLPAGLPFPFSKYEWWILNKVDNVWWQIMMWFSFLRISVGVIITQAKWADSWVHCCSITWRFVVLFKAKNEERRMSSLGKCSAAFSRHNLIIFSANCGPEMKRGVLSSF